MMKTANLYLTVLALAGFLGYLAFYKNIKSQVKNLVELYDETLLLTLTSKCHCRSNQEILITKLANQINVYLLDKSTNIKQKLLTQSEPEFANRVFTCDMYNVLRRGENQRVLGYSLYGKKRSFYDPLKETAERVRNLYQNWTMRVYYDDTIDKSVICQVECASDENTGVLYDTADFCFIKEMYLTFTDYVNKKSLNASYMHAMKWRWFVNFKQCIILYKSKHVTLFLSKGCRLAIALWTRSQAVMQTRTLSLAKWLLLTIG
jgi:hypothetical protein